MQITESPLLPPRIDPDCLASLPRGPGVYIFRGEGALPVYIGKSVDIRSRVLAHLRAVDEAAMLAQSRRVDCIETAGEIGALLLEARLIKQQNPLFNVRLRRSRSLCAIRAVQGADAVSLEVIAGKDLVVGRADDLYGLFSSEHAAREKLRELADQHRLCLGLLGLERISARGCFGVQVKTCLGACMGREGRHEHDLRLLSALAELKVYAWPYAGAVDLVEQSGDWVQRHRLQDWRYLGTWCSRTQRRSLHGQHGFDLDTYRILVRPVMMGTVRIEPV